MALASGAGIAHKSYSWPLPCRLCVCTHTSLRSPAGGSSQLRAAWISGDEEKQHFAPSGNPGRSAGFSVSRGACPVPSLPLPGSSFCAYTGLGAGAAGSGVRHAPPGPPEAVSPRCYRGRAPARPSLPYCRLASLPGMFTWGNSCLCHRPPGLCPGSRGKGWAPARSRPGAERLCGPGGAAAPLPAAGRLADMFTHPTGPLVYTFLCSSGKGTAAC